MEGRIGTDLRTELLPVMCALEDIWYTEVVLHSGFSEPSKGYQYDIV